MKTQLVSFDAAVVDFKVDPAKREVGGIILPFGEVSGPARDPQTGAVARFYFADASKVALPEDPSSVVLNYGHDRTSLEYQLGTAKRLEATDAGVFAVFGIAATPEGDRVLALADPNVGVLRKFSAEIAGAFEVDEAGVQHAVATAVTGAAVVLKPAFTGADITHVAASAAPTEKDTTMKCEKCNTVHAAGVVECQTAAPVFTAAEGADLMAKVEKLTADLAAMQDIKMPVGPGVQQFHVTEEPIYRFAGAEGAPSGFDFATDLLNAAKNGDAAALKRVQDFTAANIKPVDFGVTTDDVSATNPSKYRPDMFLGQAPVPASPLYDTFYKGGLTDVTPFFWSKFDRVNSDAGVADHVEGTDPGDGTVKTIVGVPVTPSAVSGMVHITREVADQGGNPVASGLAWAEFDRSFKIALETKTAALVLAGMAGYAALATVPTGTAGDAAGLLVEAGLIDLQFDPEGFRFIRGFGHIDLYKALALAVDGDGEKIYPILGATNRDGTTGDKFARINIAGYDLSPCPSLGATSAGAKNSLLVDPNAVHIWNSGLQRLDKLNESVEGWDLGCFGYFAGVVYDATGIRKITYTK